MDQQDPKPTRRVRYAGTHPKSFKQKYKELDPISYTEDVQKIIAQGKTPAGMHRSICVDEIVAILDIQPGQIGLDATLGYGGHSVEMIKRILPNGKLFAIDADPIEMPKTKARLQQLGYTDDVVDIRKLNFSAIDLLVYESGLFDFVLADLGLSSMQIDNPDRGFSFKVDAPLDLRLNPNMGISAAQLLKQVSLDKLAQIFTLNADEPHAKQIAQAIINKMVNNSAICTTIQLKNTITQALQFLPKVVQETEIKKACQRCFQAIRIEVNDEFNVLDKFLSKLPAVLKTNGKVAILSFHSGEDRRVKKSFQDFYRSGIYKDISHDIIRPSIQECSDNPRAKSAKLRWAIMA